MLNLNMPELGISKRLPKLIQPPLSRSSMQAGLATGSCISQNASHAVRSLCDTGSYLALSPAWKQHKCCDAEWVNLNRPKNYITCSIRPVPIWSIIRRLQLSKTQKWHPVPLKEVCTSFPPSLKVARGKRDRFPQEPTPSNKHHR